MINVNDIKEGDILVGETIAHNVWGEEAKQRLGMPYGVVYEHDIMLKVLKKEEAVIERGFGLKENGYHIRVIQLTGDKDRVLKEFLWQFAKGEQISSISIAKEIDRPVVFSVRIPQGEDVNKTIKGILKKNKLDSYDYKILDVTSYANCSDARFDIISKKEDGGEQSEETETQQLKEDIMKQGREGVAFKEYKDRYFLKDKSEIPSGLELWLEAVKWADQTNVEAVKYRKIKEDEEKNE